MNEVIWKDFVLQGILCNTLSSCMNTEWNRSLSLKHLSIYSWNKFTQVTSCWPKHIFLVNVVHGGHDSSLWQVWLTKTNKQTIKQSRTKIKNQRKWEQEDLFRLWPTLVTKEYGSENAPMLHQTQNSTFLANRSVQLPGCKHECCLRYNRVSWPLYKLVSTITWLQECSLEQIFTWPTDIPEKWPVLLPGCKHACCLEQGFPHSGEAAPQGTGGYRIAAPQ